MTSIQRTKIPKGCSASNLNASFMVIDCTVEDVYLVNGCSGVGSLEGMDKDFVAFYQECAEQAVLRGVTVSILSLTGAECQLENLSPVAEKTSGSIGIWFS